MLQVAALVTGYGKRQVLNGVSLTLAPRQILAVIGHNGAGKSTLLKAIFGMLPVWQGDVILNNKSLRCLKPCDLLHEGVAYIPQGNRVFTDLTVRENLEIGSITLPDKMQRKVGIERCLDWFPALGLKLSQKAGTLSGGEKQMLALANALVISPRIMLLDEPSLGLAPPLALQALRRVHEISSDSGAAVLIVEQKVREVLKIAELVCVLRNGSVSFIGSTKTLDDATLREAYL